MGIFGSLLFALVFTGLVASYKSAAGGPNSASQDMLIALKWLSSILVGTLLTSYGVTKVKKLFNN